jgi:putative flippase GtrA
MTPQGLLKKLIQSVITPRSFSRFAFIGMINTTAGVGLYPLINWLTNNTIDPNVLLVISYVLCTLSAFLLHRFFTFQSRGSYHEEIFKYVILSSATFVVNYVLLNLAMKYLAMSANFAQVIISTVLSAALMIANYFGLNYLVFKPTPHPPQK